MGLPKREAEFDPIPVLPGNNQTAAEFYAEALERRGTRAPLDNALAAARDALEARLTFIARAHIEEAQAIVRSALADNPDGTTSLTPHVVEACQLLAGFGAAARMQEEYDWRTMPFRRQIERMLAICDDNGWSPRKRGIAKLIAPEMGVTAHEVRLYLRTYRERRS